MSLPCSVSAVERLAYEHGENTLGVVRAERVHKNSEHGARIVFDYAHDLRHCVASVLAAAEVDDSAAENVVHNRVKLVTEQEFSSCAVAFLVAGVLPNLADDERLGVFLLD